MQDTRKKGWYIREESPLDHFIKFMIGGSIGLSIGAVIAYGMNCIYPLF